VQEYVDGPGDRLDASSSLEGSLDHKRFFFHAISLNDELGGQLDLDDPGHRRDVYAHESDGSYTWVSARPAPAEDVGREFLGSAADGSTAVFWGIAGAADRALYLQGVPGPEALSVVGDTVVRDSGRIDNLTLRVSPDGRRVLFVAAPPSPAPTNPKHLWLRLRDEDRTVMVNDPDDGVASTPENVTTVEPLHGDASAAFFTTPQALTADDLDDQVDLYRFDIQTESLALLSKAAAGAPSDGQASACAATYGVSGCTVTTVKASADGSTAYFLSPEQLDSGAVAGAPNLYARRAGATRLVATLAADDAPDRLARSLRTDEERLRPVRATDDGRRLVFESRAQLTGFDNGGLAQVYLYDFDADEISCASCPQDPGLGTPAAGVLRTPPDEPTQAMGDAAYRTAGRNITSGAEQIYFQTARRLVSSDVNGGPDVYEYDVASDALRLISSGEASRGSYYYDNSDDGEDVFFTTTETLVPPEQDLNGATWKIYDARRGGGFPPETRPGCGEADCRGALSPPPPFGEPSGPDGSADGDVAERRASVALRVRRRAVARRGRLVVGVRRRPAGRVRIVGRARLGGRMRRVGIAVRRVRPGGTERVGLRLSRAARRALARGRRLRVTVLVRTPGAFPRRARVRLVGARVDQRARGQRAQTRHGRAAR
jgi:hypothetical protein